MELRFELFPMRFVLESYTLGNALLFFSGNTVGLRFKAHSFGVSLFLLCRDAVSLSLKPHTFGNRFLSLCRDAVSFGCEPCALSFLVDSGEFGLGFNPGRLLFNERY